MFLNQSVYYNDGIDTYPVEIKKCSPKMVWIDLDGQIKRVKKTSCHYQETDGGFICVDKLDRLISCNSSKIPDYTIMKDSVVSWQGFSFIKERKATDEDYSIYPQTVDKRYIRWSNWTSEDEKGL